MNVHESERLCFMLENKGFLRAGSLESADIVIFQTCCIRNTAENKVIDHINKAKKYKKQVKNDKIQGEKDIKIAVIGCLSALREIPGVDICLGTNKLGELVEILTTPSVAGATVPPSRKGELFAQENSPFSEGGDAIASGVFGIGNSVIIMHGCDNFCAYCIVPYVRGREYSRDIAEIVKEFEDIKKCGEITLLGQNVNSYRCPRTGVDFVGLLDRLCDMDGDFRINFLSSHPKDFSDDLIRCIARNPKINRNIHLPLQSGCDRILKLMNRKYTVADYTRKINLMRELMPEICITTDIICGFPSETEQDFLTTCETMKKLQFDAAFIFPYSRRTGTNADKMDGQLDTATKKRRTTELIAIQRHISKCKTKKSF